MHKQRILFFKDSPILRERLKLLGKRFGFKGNPRMTCLEDSFKAEGVYFGYGVTESVSN